MLEYIEAAIDYAEQYQSRCLRTSTWQAVFDCFPDEIVLPKPPLVSATIAYLDTAGVSQTLSTSVYAIDAVSEPGRIALKSSQSWPSTLDQINAVTVTFVAGYASEALIPQRTRQAIRMHAAHFFENRESGEVPQAVHELLDADRFLGYR